MAAEPLSNGCNVTLPLDMTNRRSALESDYGVGVGVGEGVGVIDGVAVGVGVEVATTEGIGVAVGVGESLVPSFDGATSNRIVVCDDAIGAAVEVGVGVAVATGTGVGVGVGSGSLL